MNDFHEDVLNCIEQGKQAMKDIGVKPYGADGEVPFNFKKPSSVANHDDIQLMMSEDLQKAIFGMKIEMTEAEYQKHQRKQDEIWAEHLEGIKEIL